MNLLHLNILAAVTTVFTLSGCTTGNSGVTFGDFRNRASSLAGSGATDCGNAEIGFGNAQNTCVTTAFVEQRSAFATYDGQGTDSRVATGLAVTMSGSVYRLFFDGDPTGGGSSSNGEISVVECLNASLSGIVDGQPTEVFNCSN